VRSPTPARAAASRTSPGLSKLPSGGQLGDQLTVGCPSQQPDAVVLVVA
jgi:hypothetical protein